MVDWRSEYPDEAIAGRAYGAKAWRRVYRELGIGWHLARQNNELGSGLGMVRWLAQWTLRWLDQCRRIAYRRHWLLSIHQALVAPACHGNALRFLSPSLCSVALRTWEELHRVR